MVWVLIRVPDLQWQDQVTITGGFGGRRRHYEVGDYQGYWDTLIGVIDPVSGELLDLIRTPDWYLYFTRPGVLLSREADEFDRTMIHLRAVTISRSDSGLPGIKKEGG